MKIWKHIRFTSDLICQLLRPFDRKSVVLNQSSSNYSTNYQFVLFVHCCTPTKQATGSLPLMKSHTCFISCLLHISRLRSNPITTSQAAPWHALNVDSHRGVSVPHLLTLSLPRLMSNSSSHQDSAMVQHCQFDTVHTHHNVTTLPHGLGCGPTALTGCRPLSSQLSRFCLRTQTVLPQSCSLTARPPMFNLFGLHCTSDFLHCSRHLSLPR